MSAGKTIAVLTAVISLLVGAAAGFWIGRSGQPEENDQQALVASLGEARLFMSTLQRLDTGNIAKTRQTGSIALLANLDFIGKYITEGRVSPSPEQRQEWNKLSKEVLDFMLRHKEEWDPRLPYVRDGVRGLSLSLSEKEDLRLLSELTNYLGSAAQKMRTNQ